MKQTKQAVVEEFRVQEILEATLRVITRSGISGATMQQIADDAGIAKGTIYLYFKNRDELIERVHYFADRPDERAKIIRDMQAHLKKWEMSTVLRQRLTNVSDYLATLEPVGSAAANRLIPASQ